MVLWSSLLARSIASRLRSPLSQMHGMEPIVTRTAHATKDICMFSGGSAVGPARRASVMTVKMSMKAVTRVHMKLAVNASGTG